MFLGPPSAQYIGIENQAIDNFHGNRFEWPAARVGHAGWVDKDVNFLIFGGIGVEGNRCSALTDGWVWNGGHPKFLPVLPSSAAVWSPAAGTWGKLAAVRAAENTISIWRGKTSNGAWRGAEILTPPFGKLFESEECSTALAFPFSRPGERVSRAAKVTLRSLRSVTGASGLWILDPVQEPTRWYRVDIGQNSSMSNPYWTLQNASRCDAPFIHLSAATGPTDS